MKKLLFVLILLLAAKSVNAQFIVYQNVDVPRPSYTSSTVYGSPFTIYEPVYVDTYQSQQQQIYRQPAQPKMQQVTLKGYYNKGDKWYYTPIRVGVIEDEVILLSFKTQNTLSNCGNRVREVGAFDPEVIRDNFNYKVFTTIYGTIYF